jgi:small-conductance mechanosensitive channel
MIDDLFKRLGITPVIFLGNSLRIWFVAGVAAVAAWAALWAVRQFIASRFEGYSTAKTPTLIRLIAYLVANTTQLFLFAMAVYAAQAGLSLPDRIEHIVSNVVMILVLIQVGLWAGRAVRFYMEMKDLERGADEVYSGSLDIISVIVRLMVWALLVLVALANLGVNITALLAGLGVGGVAVALSLQNVLGDLFASLSIALDKPFMIGDNLNIDGFVGKVEHIGIKTTRLRSESGEQIIIANGDILKSRMRNFGRLAEQRILVTIRVAYDTAAEKLKEMPKLLEGIVRENPHARFERCHLRTLGESAFVFELSYFVQQPAVNPVLDLQQAVNFRIIDELRGAGIEFAYPTQLVLVEKHRVDAEK